MLNQIMLMGYISNKPDVKVYDKEDKKIRVGKFRIGVARDFRNPKTNNRDYDFLSVKCFGATADYADKFLHKGDLVVLSGRLYTESYKKDGNDYYVTLIYASNIYIARAKTSDGSSVAPTHTARPAEILTAIKQEESIESTTPDWWDEDFPLPPVDEDVFKDM